MYNACMSLDILQTPQVLFLKYDFLVEKMLKGVLILISSARILLYSCDNPSVVCGLIEVVWLNFNPVVILFHRHYSVPIAS